MSCSISLYSYRQLEAVQSSIKFRLVEDHQLIDDNLPFLNRLALSTYCNNFSCHFAVRIHSGTSLSDQTVILQHRIVFRIITIMLNTVDLSSYQITVCLPGHHNDDHSCTVIIMLLSCPFIILLFTCPTIIMLIIDIYRHLLVTMIYRDSESQYRYLTIQPKNISIIYSLLLLAIFY